MVKQDRCPGKEGGRARRGGKGLLAAVLTLMLVCSSGACRAAEAPGAGPLGVLSIEDAYGRALATHEAVMIAGERVVQAGQARNRALSAMLPNLTAEGGLTRYSDQKTAGGFLVQPDELTTVDVVLTQPLFYGGTRLSAVKQAGMLVQRSKEELDGARELVLLNTARVYYAVLKAGKDVEIKRAALKRALERKKVATARYRVGEVVKSAVLRAEAEAAGAEAELIKAGSAERDTTDALKRLVNIEGPVVLAEPAGEVSVPSGVETLISTAHQRRLDLKASSIDLGVATESVREAKGEFLPSLRVEGRYSWKDQEPRTTFFQEETVSAGLVLTYPIFEGGLKRAGLKEARSRLREAELNRTSLKRDIELQVREAFNNVEATAAVIDSYRKQLSFAREDYKMVFEQFKHGLATTVDVIDSDTELVSAESSFVNAKLDLRLALVELEYAVGALLDKVRAP